MKQRKPRGNQSDRDIPPYSSASIANMFLNKGFVAKKPVSPMQIQKLIYLAHGYHLHKYNGAPLINEVFQAWKFGPVLESIYHDCKYFGRRGITHFLSETLLDLDEDEYVIDPRPAPIPDNDEVKAIVDFVWDTYAKYDPMKLSRWTHEKGGPWDKVTNGGKRILLHKEVPNEEIENYFMRKLE